MATRFDADRVYVQVRTADGATLELYTDTGGGLLLSSAAAGRLHLAVGPATDPQARAELGPDARVSSPPAFAADEPAPPIPGQQILVSAHIAPPIVPESGDGILGQAWFAGHVWTWDYPGKQLILRPNGWVPGSGAARASLSFKSEHGVREANFPRIVVRVDGHPLSLLLDTGAETFLTPAALAVLGDSGPAFRATSMIAHSVFEGWRTAHSDWRVIDSAQAGTHSRMIEVPQLEIAGISVGPVWFTERPDANFHQFMSSMTDATVEGSLGGNALSGLEMTIDYPDAQAWFMCRQRKARRAFQARCKS